MLDAITEKVEKAVVASGYGRSEILADSEKLDEVVRINVENSIEEILANSDFLREKVAKGETRIVAAFYDTKTGKVSFKGDELMEEEA